MLHAAGIPLFRALFEQELEKAGPSIMRTARWSAAAGLAAVGTHRGFEPARIAGELDGLLDPSMHALLWASDAGTTAAVQLLGLAVILLSLARPSSIGRTVGVVGAALVASSFAFMGHTATDEQRWLLGPMLIVHVLVVSFWFGALWPLYLTGRHERLGAVDAVVQRFSAAATWLVPMIFVAGLVLSIALLRSFAALLTPYGALLLLKIGGFGALMGLAALNKGRYGPAIAAGDASAVRALGVSVRLEWAIIAIVLVVAAVMTSLFAPPSAH